MSDNRATMYSTLAKLGTLEFWLYKANSGRSKPIRVNNVRRIPFYQPKQR